MEKYQGNWHRLDNAAKIFPPNSHGLDTKVFRFSCQFIENVDEDTLNLAIIASLKDIPAFRCVLRHGMFWYYFEECNLEIKAHKEEEPPCMPIYFDASSALFRVSYYNRRLNLEVYHALTDGAGALQFLRVLVCNYLDIRYKGNDEITLKENDDLGSFCQQSSDSFDKYYSGKKIKRVKTPKIKKAYTLKGKKTDLMKMSVVEGVVSSAGVLAIARDYGCSVTELFCAIMILAIRKTLNIRDMHQPIVVSVPVNLRKYFPSRSVRNFFSVFNVGYELDSTETDLKKLSSDIHGILAKELNTEFLQARLDYLENLERKLYTKLVPLFIKDAVLHLCYLRSEEEYTTTISNMGAIKLSPWYEKYIDRFSVFNSTKDFQACVCSFNEKLCIVFTSRLVSTEIQMEFFRILRSLKIDVEIYSNNWESNALKENKI